MAATVASYPQVLMTELDFRDNRYPSISSQRSTTTNNKWPATNPQPSDEHSRSISYSLPNGTPRVVERYSLDDANSQRAPSRASSRKSAAAEPETPKPIKPIDSLPPSAPRHPSLPAAGVGITTPTNPTTVPSIIPLSASPGYVPPVISQRHRAYPQQPTYITSQTPTISPIRAPPQQPEEVCIECAMRDQDMADVDVTSPGVWERESDVHYEELKRREAEDAASGGSASSSDDPNRPRASGGRLTEQNLRIWLSLNPREPASRQQTLNNYLNSQRTLLEAEALAHAQAMQEAKQLDNRMRDTFSRLRMSAYDTGTGQVDDTGVVRIKAPHSPVSPGYNSNHSKSHSRDITLLENGMIVEHVDVRKEEREARERKRREERRARKSSRSSGIDVTSLMSTQSLVQQTDSGIGLKPYSHYASPGSPRPMSVLTAPLDRSDRPPIPRAQSQASFSDMHSMGTPSPRRSRFLGIGNLKDRWRSQDSLAPSGMSGSMIDMHLALQNEPYYRQSQSPVDMNTMRASHIWPAAELEPTESRQSRISSDDKRKKKKNGLAKIWRIVTRSTKQDGTARPEELNLDRQDDDFPLAPPPPLSYLVNREPGRHASTTSLYKVGPAPSAGMSPSTAPSSLLPSSSSSRPSNNDVEVEVRRPSGGNYEDHDPQNDESTVGKTQGLGLPSMTSEPDMRQRASSQSPSPPLPQPNGQRPSLPHREKSLPPLPNEAVPRPFPSPTDNRPQTVYTFETRPLPPGFGAPHDFIPPQAAFRTPDTRRQSFSGLSSRPTLDSLFGMSFKGKTQNSRQFSPQYDDFGNSRRSLNLLQTSSVIPPARNTVSPTPTKRKSRFGFSALLGKRPSTPSSNTRESGGVSHVQFYPTMRHSGMSDGPEDAMSNGYASATSQSRHSGWSGGGGGAPPPPAPHRLSITSRKALEELVTQDPDFVAYRYPSTEQRLDLLR